MKSSFLFCFLFLLSCGKSEQEQFTGERIVSLSPSITETLEDIGVDNLVVGRSSFCKAVNI